MRDDELRFPVVAAFRDVERVQKLSHVLAVDFLDIKAVRFHPLTRILALRKLCRGIERNGIGIVNENQIVEAPNTGERARLGCDALLQVAVTAQTDHVLVENFVLIGVEPSRGHIRRYRHANGVAHALTERSSGAFHSGRVAKFGVSRRFGMRLPEPFHFGHRQIVPADVQPCVKKHAAVPGGENENVAIDPTRLVWIVSERVPKKHGADFRATEWKPKMT